ncbi:MAG TPA: VOC family protein [Puia sp.]|nr:VOC family protein [Puia sp.]
MQKITPFLWYKNNAAEEAAKYYVGIIKDSKITKITPGPGGVATAVSFTLAGQEFVALNGNPEFPFTHAVSFLINCADQQEIDEYWDKLSAGGQKVQCGWLTDKYGVSWQVAPTVLLEMLNDKDKDKAKRVFDAMCQMQKIDIAGLKKAYAG